MRSPSSACFIALIILLANLVPLRHELDLRPLWNGVFAGVQKNICEEPRMPTITITKGMDVSQTML